MNIGIQCDLSFYVDKIIKNGHEYNFIVTFCLSFTLLYQPYIYTYMFCTHTTYPTIHTPETSSPLSTTKVYPLLC